MEPIRSIRPDPEKNPLPADYDNHIIRVTKATAKEATWACNVCGIILPRQVKSGPAKGRWINSKCSCQVVAEEQLLRDEIHEVSQRNLVTTSFGWLGHKYSDISLAVKSFENFDRDRQPEAFDAALNFADIPGGSLILESPGFGTGKTHLLAAVCNKLRERNIRSHFVPEVKLFRALQERMDLKESYGDIIFKLTTVPFLVIDDVGKAKSSEWKSERYHEIIDERTNNKLPTGISTNKYDNLEDYVGGAAKSRLQIGRVVIEMNPFDYRQLL